MTLARIQTEQMASGGGHIGNIFFNIFDLPVSPSFPHIRIDQPKTMHVKNFPAMTPKLLSIKDPVRYQTTQISSTNNKTTLHLKDDQEHINFVNNLVNDNIYHHDTIGLNYGSGETEWSKTVTLSSFKNESEYTARIIDIDVINLKLVLDDIYVNDKQVVFFHHYPFKITNSIARWYGIKDVWNTHDFHSPLYRNIFIEKTLSGPVVKISKNATLYGYLNCGEYRGE